MCSPMRINCGRYVPDVGGHSVALLGGCRCWPGLGLFTRLCLLAQLVVVPYRNHRKVRK